MATITNRDALHVVLNQMRDLAAGVEIKQSEIKELRDASKAAWSMAATVFESCIGFANVDVENVSIPDAKYIEKVCKDLRIPYGNDLDKEFLYGDNLPMSDGEFEKWYKMLINSVWNNDPKLAKQTVGEMWDVLIKEHNFPKERFHNECKRRGVII